MENALELLDDPAYEAWRGVVAARLARIFGLRLEDLPELPLRRGFERGLRPHLFFFETVMPAVRERVGDLADAVLDARDGRPEAWAARP